MKVLKFGGTSVGSPERMKEVVRLITDGEQKIVVLSAMSGTTNALVEIADYMRKGNIESAGSKINEMKRKYGKHLTELYTDDSLRARTEEILSGIFNDIHSVGVQKFTDKSEKAILAQGELMSTNMVTNYMIEQGYNVKLINALDYMVLTPQGEPDMGQIKVNLEAILAENPGYEIYITQGFICRDHEGDIANLQRGGSDYTACIIGSVLRGEEIQIWTDIDGMHNNDPRFVEGTHSIRQLNFEEAAELAYFGAKILHPTCIQPAKYAGVPVRLLNTMDPSAPGTLINNEMTEGHVKAVAAKDNITAIKIVSSRMLLASGFLSKLFQVFEKYRTSIDMITTSEVGVSLTIDDTSRLMPILEELKTLGTVEVDENMCIICVAGDLAYTDKGFVAQIAQAMHEIPMRMISYGGSNHNVSFLLSMENKIPALRALQTLF